jgi:hypothetical protein
VAYTDLTEVRDCYARLRELVIHNAGGWDDVDSRSKVERLCKAAMDALEDTECQERLRTVLTQASELYSREVIDTLRTRTSQMPHPHAG